MQELPISSSPSRSAECSDAEAAKMAPIAWTVSQSPVDYPTAVRFMEDRVAGIANGHASELIWLLEHPPIYTAGTSARRDDLIDPDRFPVFQTGRGGQYTYHGPGQRIVYVMLNLRRFGGDVRAFVHALENWVIRVLADYGVAGRVHPDRVGVWVETPAPGGQQTVHEEKIAAIGVRVRRWVSFHGLSLNVAPDLSHFGGIVPCGIREHGVTSLSALGAGATMRDVDERLRAAFQAQFPTCELTLEPTAL